MMTKHTPGPWAATRESAATWTVGSVDFGTICNLHDPYRIDMGLAAQIGQDAQLIAAAPDLLEALETIAELAGNLPDDRLESRTGPNDAAHRGLMVTAARKIARAAIARAKGER